MNMAGVTSFGISDGVRDHPRLIISQIFGVDSQALDQVDELHTCRHALL